MASAWGNSWGKSWGNAWGTIAQDSPTPRPELKGTGGTVWGYAARLPRKEFRIEDYENEKATVVVNKPLVTLSPNIVPAAKVPYTKSISPYIAPSPSVISVLDEPAPSDKVNNHLQMAVLAYAAFYME